MTKRAMTKRDGEMRGGDRRTLALLVVVAQAAGAWACGDDEASGVVEGVDSGAPETGTVATLDAATEDATRPQKAPFDPADEPVVCAVDPCAVELVAGESHFCARMSDRTVRCWGGDESGALGGGEPPADASDAGPFHVGRVADLEGVEQISAGGNTTCALREDGTVHCWGANDLGQLGLQASPAASDTLAHPNASAVALTVTAARVDVGPGTACAVATSGETWCWGDNTSRQLARAETADVGGPAPAALGGLTLKRTWHGSFTSFGLTDADEIVTWGAVGGPSASVAARSSSISPDPEPLPIGLGGVTSFSVSASVPVIPEGDWRPSKYIAHACAITKGEASCWGVSQAGALATGLPDDVTRPTSVYVPSAAAYPQRVTAAGETTCVRLTDGTVQCAGDNARGELGRGDDAGVKFMASFTGAKALEGHAVQVAASTSAVCALIQGGAVRCWGSNGQGELGQGTKDLEPHSSPVTVSF